MAEDDGHDDGIDDHNSDGDVGVPADAEAADTMSDLTDERVWVDRLEDGFAFKKEIRYTKVCTYVMSRVADVHGLFLKDFGVEEKRDTTDTATAGPTPPDDSGVVEVDTAAGELLSHGADLSSQLLAFFEDNGFPDFDDADDSGKFTCFKDALSSHTAHSKAVKTMKKGLKGVWTLRDDDPAKAEQFTTDWCNGAR